jgi:hypothetical protein
MQAFVYIEIDNSMESSRKNQPVYIIAYKGHLKNGCSKMHSLDENFIKTELTYLRKRPGVTLLSRLPPQVKSLEGTIERKPYDLSSLLQTSARNNGNKQKAKK